MRSIALLIYLLIFVFALHNAVCYLYGKQRYKEFSIMLFYVFTFGLVISRALEFTINLSTYLFSKQIKNCIVMADGCSVCICLS